MSQQELEATVGATTADSLRTIRPHGFPIDWDQDAQTQLRSSCPAQPIPFSFMSVARKSRRDSFLPLHCWPVETLVKFEPSLYGHIQCSEGTTT